MTSRARIELWVAGPALMVGLLVGCSSDDTERASVTIAAPAVTPPATIDSPQDFVDYYVALGTEPAVATCFAEVLTELGITDMAMLEDDQSLGEQAVDRFAVCSASGGERSIEG